LSTLNEQFIRRTFELASQGLGKVGSNPLVGCVVVHGNKIISEGFHQKFGGPHAEVEALAKLSSGPIGPEQMTLYCNLEPCCHTNKKTPPCTEKIISSGIKNVVISNLDPNPEVSGNGVKRLQEKGISVTVGVLAEEGKKINEVFFKYIKNKIPFVHLKWAQSKNGKIADSNKSERTLISDLEAQKEVHYLRAKYEAICVGKNTVLVDNPKLNVRYGFEKFKDCPYRTILGAVKNKEKYQIFADEFKHKTLEFIGLNSQDFLLELGKQGISSVLVEGGAMVLRGFLQQNLWDRLTIYEGPLVIANGPSVIEDLDNFSTSLSQKWFRVLNDQRVFEARR
jgi:diaminohydroxyphosphoribosylaminopyrimidine deaminase / 5-amino-6-(5-phosphoribosylamino)uracil reductase